MPSARYLTRRENNRRFDRIFCLAIIIIATIPASRLLADPPNYTATIQLDLGGDHSTASAQSGGIAGNAQIPGGETHAFLLNSGSPMIDLGTLGGIRSAAGIIDNSGNVLGVSQLADGVSHAFLYRSGAMTDLGNFPGGATLNSGPIGIDSAGQVVLNIFGSGVEYAALWQNNQITNLGNFGGNSTRALAMNSSGEVVGYSSTAGNATQAFTYSSGTLTNLTNFPGVLATAAYSESDGVSDTGIVAGTYSTSSSASRAFVFANGQTTDIGTLGGNSAQVYAVAANGDVLGESLTAAGYEHAFVYRNGVMTDLGTLNGVNANSSSSKENSTGQIIGGSDTATAGASHAFITNGSGLTDLGTLGGITAGAFAINAAGTVVGSSLLADNITRHAFEYQNGSISDLGTLGGTTSSANSINDAGQIVGSATTAAGQYRALTLVNGQVTAIPTLGGATSQANAANAAGQVVGFSQIPAGTNHAFLYQSGVVTDLNNILGGQSSTAAAINALGQIAGTYQPAGADTSHQRAFIDTNGVITDLGTLGGASSQANVMNSKGDVVGTSFNSSFNSQVFLYSNGVMKNVDPNDVGGSAVAVNNDDQILFNTGAQNSARFYSNGSVVNPAPAGAVYSTGVAMNSHGDVVGNFQTLTSSGAFLYSNGQSTDLSTLFGPGALIFATDINDAGDILGRVSFPNNQQYAFLDSGGTIYDLNNYVSGLPPGWTLQSATFYPGTSDLLGEAYEGFRTTTFLLAVPEPAAAAMLFVIFPFLLIRRRSSASSSRQEMK